MDALAKRCKLAKGTLYLYFRTREEVLLALLKVDFDAWFSEMKTYLAKAKQPFAPSFAKVWLRSLQARPRLAMGMAYLHLMLETNISEEFALEWKRYLFQQMQGLHYLILDRFTPHLSFARMMEVVSLMTGLSVGFWTQSQVSPQMAAAFKRSPELLIFASDFPAQFLTAASAVLLSDACADARRLNLKA